MAGREDGLDISRFDTHASSTQGNDLCSEYECLGCSRGCTESQVGVDLRGRQVAPRMRRHDKPNGVILDSIGNRHPTNQFLVLENGGCIENLFKFNGGIAGGSIEDLAKFLPR